MRLAILALTLGGCARAATTVADVPIAFGRWGPPEGQSCYVDALRPPELPALSALLDSAAVVAELRGRGPGEVLIGSSAAQSRPPVGRARPSRRQPLARSRATPPA